MIKVNILNLDGFLKVINQCHGRVMMVSPEGRKINITRRYLLQNELERQFEERGNFLPLSVRFFQ